MRIVKAAGRRSGCTVPIEEIVIGILGSGSSQPYAREQAVDTGGRRRLLV